MDAAKGGAPYSQRGRDVRVFLREAQDNAKRTSERIHEFANRLRLLTERSAALAKRPPPAADLLAELRERETELTHVHAELRREHEQLLQARRFLERERARYADLFDSSPEAYIETDAHGVMREANRATATLLAHPQEQLIGKLLIAFVARGDTRAFRRHLLALGGPEGGRTFQVRMRPRGGAPFLAAASVRAVPGTGSHRWMLRPTAAPTSVEARLVETIALAARELRAPLTAAMGWLQMLRERVVPDSERESVLAAIYESAWTQSQLVDDLAEIAQLRRGRGPGRRELTALTELVSHAAEGVRAEALHRRVSVLIEQAGAEPLLECDEPRATRAIARLLEWAVRSAPEGTHVLARVMHSGDEAMLELHAPGASSLGESALGLAAVNEALALDGARLALPTDTRGGPICSVRWTMRVPTWRREPELSKCASDEPEDVAEVAD
jgi:PAS domain S-box-containing protein